MDEALSWTIPVSNSGKNGRFLSTSKRLEWLWGPHSLLAHLYRSSGIKRPEHEPNKLLVFSAEVMISANVPLVLRFQVNEQQ